MSMILDGNGTVTGLVAGGLPNATIVQDDLASGVAGNGPAFSAYLGTTQTVSSGVATKLQLTNEVFDTNSNFDNVTNYRFTPTVAGYYQFTYQVYGGAGTTMTALYAQLNKNGSVYQYASLNNGNYGNSAQGIQGSSLIYLNGSTDYVELYGTIGGTGTCSFTAIAGGPLNYLSGVLVRAA